MLIQGSPTPSVLLGRRQRQWVPLTARVQRLIDRGFVTVVARQSVQLGKRTHHG